MFKYRIISFPLLLFLLYLIFFQPWGSWIFIVGAPVVIALALYEAGKLFSLCKIENDPVFTAELGGIGAFLFFLNCFFGFQTGIFSLLLMIVILAEILLLLCTLLFSKDEVKFRKLFNSVAIAGIFGYCYILFASFYFDRMCPFFLLYLMLTAKAMDTGGYVFGMISNKLMPGGNHKIAPSISPKKSWEGFFGGMAFSIAVSMIFWRCLGNFAWYFYLAGGVLLALLSFAGDLTESALKRRAGVKDSAQWIPGMGGVLDVLDSFLYIGPAVALIAAVSAIFSI
ncbi:MAG: phosphatidate cytidylyltransferase [Victivallaceae bacterium]|nr:phosphatidate cytidylyltransferase [Victivallaceae bacterium]